MENNDNKSFQFTYSAKEQEEILAIRKKYTSQDKEDVITKIRRLDESVTRKSTTPALIVGIIGALILGFGMSLVMTDLGKIFGTQSSISMLLGICIGIVGMILVCVAYPLYNILVKKQKEKVAPEILRLTDELIK